MPQEPVCNLNQYTQKEIGKVCAIPRVIAFKYAKHHPKRDPEEIESFANMEIAVAISKHNPSRGMTLSSYCYGRVKSRVLAWLHSARHKRELYTISLNNKLDKVSNEGTEHIDSLQDYSKNELLPSERKELVDSLLGRIRPTNRKIVTLYCSGKIFTEIAKEVGLTTPTVRERYYSSISLLRRHLKGKRQTVNNISKWMEKNPEESRRHNHSTMRKGRRTQSRMLNRRKKAMGWVEVDLSVCSLLYFLSDEVPKSIMEIRDSLQWARGHFGRVIKSARDAGYVKRVTGGKGQKRVATTYAITQKAIDERYKASKKG